MREMNLTKSGNFSAKFLLTNLQDDISSRSMVKAKMTLAEARRQAKLTQEQVAKHMGIDITTVSKWENGVSTPRMPVAEKLVELYGLGLDEIAWEAK